MCMTSNVQVRSGPLSSWLESAAALASRPRASATDSERFSSVIQEERAPSSVPPREGPPPGLAPFNVPPGLVQSGLISVHGAFQDGTETESDPAQQNPGGTGDVPGRKADWGPEGYPFLDVDDAEVRPANEVLLWRRPAEPPPLAKEAKLALAAAMRKAGLDPGDFAVSYWEALGENPWGSEVISELTIVLPNGNRIDVSARWTRDTPEITLEDIRRAMNQPLESSGTQT